MKIDLSEYKINACEYCKNHFPQYDYNTQCMACVAKYDNISIPTRFESTDEFISKYLKLRSEYARILSGLGFDLITR